MLRLSCHPARPPVRPGPQRRGEAGGRVGHQAVRQPGLQGQRCQPRRQWGGEHAHAGQALFRPGGPSHGLWRAPLFAAPQPPASLNTHTGSPSEATNCASLILADVAVQPAQAR
ncbi:hypothetical protein F751_3682 [Auxenochlorella protothecoides]|uniref:Uncharacterized protein n=1 Tax=Auxenochlorella protothecoides TaxID=3075 RepID=A0A087STL1_AUXPR|nr:hypothetical protein F751_3682 [Auxenochlorella protothecoides]KFM29065.1 hypothetical protein F751_3682 [Auxenochlorella protothecoides]